MLSSSNRLWFSVRVSATRLANVLVKAKRSSADNSRWAMRSATWIRNTRNSVMNEKYCGPIAHLEIRPAGILQRVVGDTPDGKRHRTRNLLRGFFTFTLEPLAFDAHVRWAGGAGQPFCRKNS